MKLNENYILKTVAGTPVVVPVGEAVKELHGMITLNATAELIWKQIESGASEAGILEVLKKEFNAPEDVLKADLEDFLGQLRKRNILSD